MQRAARFFTRGHSIAFASFTSASETRSLPVYHGHEHCNTFIRCTNIAPAKHTQLPLTHSISLSAKTVPSRTHVENYSVRTLFFRPHRRHHANWFFPCGKCAGSLSREGLRQSHEDTVSCERLCLSVCVPPRSAVGIPLLFLESGAAFYLGTNRLSESPWWSAAAEIYMPLYASTFAATA